MALPKITTDRIKAASRAYAKSHGCKEIGYYALNYEAGAIAEHNHMQEELKNAQDAAIMFCNKYNVAATQLAEMVDQAQRLAEALERIAGNGNELIPPKHEMISIARDALQQYNARPCPHCGKELNRDRNLCCRECGEEVEG